MLSARLHRFVAAIPLLSVWLCLGAALVHALRSSLVFRHHHHHHHRALATTPLSVPPMAAGDRSTTAERVLRHERRSLSSSSLSSGAWGDGEATNATTSSSDSGSSTNGTPSSSSSSGGRSFRKRLSNMFVSWSGSGSSSNNDNNSHENGAAPSDATTDASKAFVSSRTTTLSQQATPTAAARALVDEAFGPAEDSLRELEESLVRARTALADAKTQSFAAIEALEARSGLFTEDPTASEEPANGTTAPRKAAPALVETDFSDLESLSFEDIDYESSDMAPPFLDQDSCLVPGAPPVVRIEKAPENSRRIFAGIDILGASTDDVWKVLTNYPELQNVIPNLAVNDVLDLYDGTTEGDEEPSTPDDRLAEEVRCEQLSKTMKGSLLRQVGRAKVSGINFSARTTLEVREWPRGMPDYAHFLDEMWEGKSREERAQEYPRIKLKRYRFPRPFCVSDLPTRDISMQSIPGGDGEFRLYQGVWRMQPLVGCSPPGKPAMRLTYAVEISPRIYLPVKLVEGRIVQDLCANLEAIRDAVASPELVES